jgi:hypothetical protein
MTETRRIEPAIIQAVIDSGVLALETALFKQDYASPLEPYTRNAIARDVSAAMIARAIL